MRGATRRDILAGASAYLRLFAVTAGGAMLARTALETADGPLGAAAFAKARFFAQTMMRETGALRATVADAGAALGEAARSLLVDG
jgi:hypothetical protein